MNDLVTLEIESDSLALEPKTRFVSRKFVFRGKRRVETGFDSVAKITSFTNLDFAAYS